MERCPDAERRVAARSLLAGVSERLAPDAAVVARARAYAQQGLKAADALHQAAAEAGQCDILLTTDDPFLRRARLLQPPSRVRVENPVTWLMEVMGT